MRRLFLVTILAIFLGCSTPPEVVVEPEPPKPPKLYVRVAAFHEGKQKDLTISKSFLEQLRDTSYGDPVILGHDHKSPDNVVGRVVDAVIAWDAEAELWALELLLVITHEPAIAKIKLGLYRDVSIYFIAKGITTPFAKIPTKGEMKELSFVAIPGDVDARVLEYSEEEILLLPLPKPEEPEDGDEEKDSGDDKESPQGEIK